MNAWWGIVSIAFCISKKTAQTSFRESSIWNQSWVVANRAVTVDFPFWNPHWAIRFIVICKLMARYLLFLCFAYDKFFPYGITPVKNVVRQVKWRWLHIASENLVIALFNKQMKAIKPSSPSGSPVVDGFQWQWYHQAKLANLLSSDDHSHRNALFQEFSTRTSPADLKGTFVSEQIVSDSLLSLGLDKFDGTKLCLPTTSLLLPLIDLHGCYLGWLFTVVLRHGYMPSALSLPP